MKYFTGGRGVVTINEQGDTWIWGGVVDTTPPFKAFDSDDVKIISASSSYSGLLMLSDAGEVYCVGYETFCKATTTSSPLKIAGLSNIKRVVAANKGGFAQQADGTWLSFGSGHYWITGRSGCTSGSAFYPPAPVDNIPKGCDLHTGWSHAYCLLPNSTSAWAWGRNTHGQLGEGFTNTSVLPHLVPLPGVVKQMILPLYNTFAIVEGQPQSTYYACGSDEGRLGRGPGQPAYQLTPLLVAPPNLAGKTIVQLGNHLVRTSDNEVYTWGNPNAHGQLGRPVIGDDYTVPMRVDLDPNSFNWLHDYSGNVVVRMTEEGLHT